MHIIYGIVLALSLHFISTMYEYLHLLHSFEIILIVSYTTISFLSLLLLLFQYRITSSFLFKKNSIFINNGKIFVLKSHKHQSQLLATFYFITIIIWCTILFLLQRQIQKKHHSIETKREEKKSKRPRNNHFLLL